VRNHARGVIAPHGVAQLFFNRSDIRLKLVLRALFVLDLDRGDNVRTSRAHTVVTLLNDRHDFVPLAFDASGRRREFEGQTRLLDNFQGVRDFVRRVRAVSDWNDGEFNKHWRYGLNATDMAPSAVFDISLSDIGPSFRRLPAPYHSRRLRVPYRDGGFIPQPLRRVLHTPTALEELHQPLEALKRESLTTEIKV